MSHFVNAVNTSESLASKYNLYDQAEKLRSKVPRLEARSNQHVYLLVVILSYQLVIVAF